MSEEKLPILDGETEDRELTPEEISDGAFMRKIHERQDKLNEDETERYQDEIRELKGGVYKTIPAVLANLLAEAERAHELRVSQLRRSVQDEASFHRLRVEESERFLERKKDVFDAEALAAYQEPEFPSLHTEDEADAIEEPVENSRQLGKEHEDSDSKVGGGETPHKGDAHGESGGLQIHTEEKKQEDDKKENAESAEKTEVRRRVRDLYEKIAGRDKSLLEELEKGEEDDIETILTGLGTGKVFVRIDDGINALRVFLANKKGKHRARTKPQTKGPEAGPQRPHMSAAAARKIILEIYNKFSMVGWSPEDMRMYRDGAWDWEIFRDFTNDPSNSGSEADMIEWITKYILAKKEKFEQAKKKKEQEKAEQAAGPQAPESESEEGAGEPVTRDSLYELKYQAAEAYLRGEGENPTEDMVDAEIPLMEGVPGGFWNKAASGVKEEDDREILEELAWQYEQLERRRNANAVHNRRQAHSIPEQFQDIEHDAEKKEYDPVRKFLRETIVFPVPVTAESRHLTQEEIEAAGIEYYTPASRSKGTIRRPSLEMISVTPTYHDVLDVREQVPVSLRNELDAVELELPEESGTRKWKKIYVNAKPDFIDRFGVGGDLESYRNELLDLFDLIQDEQIPDAYAEAVLAGQIGHTEEENEEPPLPGDSPESSVPAEKSPEEIAAENRAETLRLDAEFEGRDFDRLKREHDPIFLFIRDTLQLDPESPENTKFGYWSPNVPAHDGTPGERASHNSYHSLLQSRALMGRADFDAIHALPNERDRTIEPVLSHELRARLNDPHDALHIHLEEWERLRGNLEAELLADTYPAEARQLKGIQEKARADALAVPAERERPEDDAEMRKHDPFIGLLRSTGKFTEEQLQGEVDIPSFSYITMSNPRRGTNPSGSLVATRIPFHSYHRAVRARASLPQDERSNLDSYAWGTTGDMVQRIAMRFTPELIKRFEDADGDLHEFLPQFQDLINVRIRHELLPDQYAESVIAPGAPEAASASPSPLAPSTGPLYGPERAPVAEEVVDEFQKFHLTRENLNGISEFRALDANQQRLVCQNLDQLTLARIQEEARAAFRRNQPSAKVLGSNAIGKIWHNASKTYQIAKLEKTSAKDILEGGIEAHGEIIRQLARGMEAMKLEVHEVDGKLEIDYASLRDLLPEDVEPALHDEAVEAADAFNADARKFAKVPREWGFESATAADRRAYEKAEEKYNASRAKLSDAYLRTHGGDEMPSAIYMNELDSRVKLNQYFNVHPDAEGEINRIETQGPLWRSSIDIVTERGIYSVGGLFNRTISIQGSKALAVELGAKGLLTKAAVGTAAASSSAALIPMLTGATGYVFGRVRARTGLREQEQRIRRGEMPSATNEKQSEKEQIATDKLAELYRQAAALPADSSRHKKMEKKIKRLEKKLGTKKESARAALHLNRDFVDAKGREGVREDGTRFRKKGLTEKLNAAFEKASSATDEAEKKKLVRELKFRIDYTIGKLESGEVRFSDAENSRDIGMRLNEQIDLTQAISQGATFLMSVDGDMIPERKKFEGDDKAEKRDEAIKEKDTQAHLERFMEYQQGLAKKGQSEHIHAEAKKAAYYAAGASLLGAGAREVGSFAATHIAHWFGWGHGNSAGNPIESHPKAQAQEKLTIPRQAPLRPAPVAPPSPGGVGPSVPPVPAEAAPSATFHNPAPSDDEFYKIHPEMRGGAAAAAVQGETLHSLADDSATFDASAAKLENPNVSAQEVGDIFQGEISRKMARITEKFAGGSYADQEKILGHMAELEKAARTLTIEKKDSLGAWEVDDFLEKAAKFHQIHGDAAAHAPIEVEPAAHPADVPPAPGVSEPTRAPEPPIAGFPASEKIPPPVSYDDDFVTRPAGGTASQPSEAALEHGQPEIAGQKIPTIDSKSPAPPTLPDDEAFTQGSSRPAETAASVERGNAGASAGIDGDGNSPVAGGKEPSLSEQAELLEARGNGNAEEYARLTSHNGEDDFVVPADESAAHEAVGHIAAEAARSDAASHIETASTVGNGDHLDDLKRAFYGNSETAREALRPSSLSMPRGFEHLIDPRNPADALLGRNIVVIDQILAGKGAFQPQEFLAIDQSLKGIASTFTRQPIIVQDEIMNHLKGLEQALAPKNRIFMDMSVPENQIGQTLRIELNDLKHAHRLAQNQFFAKIGSNGGSKGWYEKTILGNPGMTVKSVLLTHDANITASKNNTRFVDWLIKDWHIADFPDKDMPLDLFMRSNFRPSNPGGLPQQLASMFSWRRSV